MLLDTQRLSRANREFLDFFSPVAYSLARMAISQNEATIYSILSYTWGRFEASSGPHLDISGVHWRMLSVKDTHFAVAQFERVLQQMTSSYDHDEFKQHPDNYVWLAVACINPNISASPLNAGTREA